MKYHAVIDTNVLVSALLQSNSVPGNVLELALLGIVTPILNDEIFAEYREVLSRPKFHFSDDVIVPLLERLENQALFVKESAVDLELPDPKDRVFYEVVMEGRKAKDAYLVTGNMKHFPVKPFIVTPRQFLDIILDEKHIDSPEDGGV